MRARRDAGMHARSRERGRSCRLQNASSQRPGGMLCWKVQVRKGERKAAQREGYVGDMGRTRMDGLDGDETGDGGTGNGPHGSTGNGTGEGEGEKRQTYGNRNRNRRHGNGNGPGQPEQDSQPSKDRVPSRTADGTVRPSLVSSLFPFPFPSFIRGVHRPWTWMDVEQTPSSPPLAKS